MCVCVRIVTYAYLVLGTELRVLCVLDKHTTELTQPVALDLQSEASPYSNGEEIPVSHLVPP